MANATLTALDVEPCGEGATTVAADSTHVRACDLNIITEWHCRYGGRGILIFWHVERRPRGVRSRTLRASASEVHAMKAGRSRPSGVGQAAQARRPARGSRPCSGGAFSSATKHGSTSPCVCGWVGGG
ncbi:Tn3 family transposase [Nonomuraea rubra]|uniref:Tn3 family transposase n=1 Tax=Nonomuraea rubra TaxID=46180 RepID=UPI0033C5F66B